MDLTAEQLKQNWDTLLAKINNNFSGERRDKLIGVWFRVGITNENNQLVWRNKASPESLMDQSWDSY